MALVVHLNRTNVITVSLGMDVSNDLITSEIRTESGLLIATWVVEFDADGTDGEMVFKLDNSVTSLITQPSGLMDVKRVSNGEPYAVFDKPIEVEFRKVVTV